MSVNEVTGIDISKLNWKRFRKRPNPVWAAQLDEEIEVHTLEGIMKAKPGDWLIEGVEGELYPCKVEIFEKTYETIDDPERSP